MGRSNGTPKSVLIATRVTPRIEKLVKQMAFREGLYVSEWVRKIMITELSKNDLITIRDGYIALKDLSST